MYRQDLNHQSHNLTYQFAPEGFHGLPLRVLGRDGRSGHSKEGEELHEEHEKVRGLHHYLLLV